MQKMKRGDAARAGLHKYFTGVACQKGHLDLRVTNTGACLGCLRDYSRKNYFKLKQYKVWAQQKRALTTMTLTVFTADKARIEKYAKALFDARCLQEQLDTTL